MLDYHDDGVVERLTTAALPGLDATRSPLSDDPGRLVPALARGLRAWHDALPVADCPFDSRLDVALPAVAGRVRRGLVDPVRHFHEEHAHLGPRAALAQLHRTRPVEVDLVVCHGDYCLPNVLLDDEGTVTGYVDLGELGAADRWWDLAVATWSLDWNLGPGWEQVFLDTYGAALDPDRRAFYRLLYDLIS